jgi:hypothetical protein
VSFIGRPKPVPPPQSPPVGIAVLRPEGDATRHAVEHFFHGVCICGCSLCQIRHEFDVVQCTCLACPAEKCGAKVPTRVGGRR